MVFFSASKTPLPTPALTRTTRHHPHVVTQSASSQSNASSSNDSTVRVATGFTTHDEEDVLEDHHRTSTNATATTTGRGTRRSAVLTMMSPIQLQDVARKQFEDRERRRAQQVRRSSFPRRRESRKRNPTQHFFSKVFSSPIKKGGFLLGVLFFVYYYDSILTLGFVCLLTPHQAEDRLRDFRSGRFQPPNREKMSFNKATPHFFSAGVTPPNAGGGAFSLDAAVFERLETC